MPVYAGVDGVRVSLESTWPSHIHIECTDREKTGEARCHVDAAEDEAVERQQGLLPAALGGIREALEDGQEALLEDALALVGPVPIWRCL